MRAARQRIFPQELPKVLIAMPIYEGVNPFTLASIQKTDKYYMERGLSITRWGPVGVSQIDRARNECVDFFLEGDYTHLLWIDDDMVWNPEAIETMLFHNVDACSALVTQRFPPFNVTIFGVGKSPDGKALRTYNIPIGSYPLDEPFFHPGSGIGTAFMLLKRRVLEEMERPWFACPPTSWNEVRGEDFFFCMKMGAMGVDILYDPTIRIYHMGMTPFGLEDCMVYRRLELEKRVNPNDTRLNDVTAEVFKKSFVGPDPEYIKANATIIKEIAIKRLQDANSGIQVPGVSTGDGRPGSWAVPPADKVVPNVRGDSEQNNVGDGGNQDGQAPNERQANEETPTP